MIIASETVLETWRWPKQIFHGNTTTIVSYFLFLHQQQMHGSLTFLLIPSSQIKPAPHRQTVVSCSRCWGVASLWIPVKSACRTPATLNSGVSFLRCTYEPTLTTIPPMTLSCHVESWGCLFRRETSFTLSARMTLTGGRRTGMETKRTNLWLDSFQVGTRTDRKKVNWVSN